MRRSFGYFGAKVGRALSVVGAVGLVIACQGKTSKKSAADTPIGQKLGLEEAPAAPMTQEETVLFQNDVASSFRLTKYESEPGSIRLEQVDSGDPIRGVVIEAEKSGAGTGNVFISAANGHMNFMAMADATLVFDIKVLKMGEGGALIKMDSDYPQASDIAMPLTASPLWQTVMVPVAALVQAENSLQPGQRFSLDRVANPFVIEPRSSAPWHIQIDNVRITKNLSALPKSSDPRIALPLSQDAALASWDNNTGAVKISKAQADGLRGPVVAIEKTVSGPGNAFFTYNGRVVDLSGFADGQLVFDLNVLAMETAPLRLRMDSGWPAVSDLMQERPALNSWQTMSVPLATIMAATNSTDPSQRARLAALTNVFVIEPASVSPWHLQLANVHIVKSVSPGKGVILPTPAPIRGVLPISGEGVYLAGKVLMVNGRPFNIKGVCYNPVRKGQGHPDGLMYANPSAEDLKNIQRDIDLMKEAGINTARLYEVITDQRVLDMFQQAGIYLILPALNYYGKTDEDVIFRVNLLKDQPTTLMWDLGNEWNYNGLYDPEVEHAENKDAKMREKVLPRIKRLARVIKELDKKHPITTVYGGLPPRDIIDELADIDVFGFNVYQGISFGDLFTRWAALSSKPMYMSEYGADALDARGTPQENVGAQAEATEKLTRELMSQLATLGEGKQVLGGTIFEWNDEWWKGGPGTSPAIHDLGGIAPGAGPFPDSVFNEEWWGIVDIDRNPRPAYEVLKGIYRAIP